MVNRHSFVYRLVGNENSIHTSNSILLNLHDVRHILYPQAYVDLFVCVCVCVCVGEWVCVCMGERESVCRRVLVLCVEPILSPKESKIIHPSS